MAPAQSDLRYFRPQDQKAANDLAELIKLWNFGTLRPRLIPGSEAQAQLRQFEIWFARPDATQITRLLQQINAATPEERKTAGQQLQDRYTASPLAIAETLSLFEADRITALSPDGRINALFFLTRTAPLAWDAALAVRARQVVERIRASANVGDQTKAELERLVRLLDAVNAGEAAAPVEK